jgi:hypothetical protein
MGMKQARVGGCGWGTQCVWWANEFPKAAHLPAHKSQPLLDEYHFAASLSGAHASRAEIARVSTAQRASGLAIAAGTTEL